MTSAAFSLIELNTPSLNDIKERVQSKGLVDVISRDDVEKDLVIPPNSETVTGLIRDKKSTFDSRP